MPIPDPYGRSVFRGVLLDNATIAALKEAEEILGYELTISQGIGLAAASGDTHREGRAADLAPWDHVRKVRVLRDLGFIAFFRPELWRNGVRIWPAHVHVVLIFESRTNRRGVSAAGFAQIAKYDDGQDALAGTTPDPDPYRPSPPRVFTLEDYRASFEKPKPSRGKRVDEALAELREAKAKAKGARRAKIAAAIRALTGIKPKGGVR